ERRTARSFERLLHGAARGAAAAAADDDGRAGRRARRDRALRRVRLGRAPPQHGRALAAVRARRDAVVAETVGARAGVADGAGDEAVLLAARRARRAADDLPLAVDVEPA